MYPAVAPEITELFQEMDGMFPCLSVEAIDRLAQFFLRLVPVVMRDFFLQPLPGRLSRILFRRIRWEVNDLQTAVCFQPLSHFIAGMMRSLINPEHDLSSGQASSSCSNQQIVASESCQSITNGTTSSPVPQWIAP